MNIRSFLLSALFLTALAINAQVKEAIPYKVNVQEFHELLVSHGINVDYRCSTDSAGMAVFRATPEMTSKILFSNPNGKLKIELSPEDKDTLNGIPTVMVYSSYLTKVENRGDSLVRVLSNMPGPSMKARLEGNGKVVVDDVHVTTFDASLGHSHGEVIVNGICKEAKINLTGKGRINAENLKSTNVKCSVFGAGVVKCWVNGGTLTVQGVSSATVFYKGTPINIKKRSMGTKIVSIDDELAPAD